MRKTRSRRRIKSRLELRQAVIALKNRKKIEALPGLITKEKIDPDQVLAKAYGELDDVVLVGMGKDDEYYFASSVPDAGDIIWYVEKLKQKLLEIT